MSGNKELKDPIAKMQSANTVVTIHKCLLGYIQMFEETITLCGALHYFEALVPSDDDGSPLSLMGWNNPKGLKMIDVVLKELMKECG